MQPLPGAPENVHLLGLCFAPHNLSSASLAWAGPWRPRAPERSSLRCSAWTPAASPLTPPTCLLHLPASPPGLGSQRACGRKAGTTAGHPRPFPVSTEAGSAARERGQDGRGPSHRLGGGGYGSGAGGVGSLAPQEDPAGGQRGMRGDVPLGSAASAFHPLLDFSETPTPHGPTCLPKTWLLIPRQRLPGRPPPVLWSPLGPSCLAGTQPARTGPGPHAAPPTPVPRVCPPRPPPRTPVLTPPPAFSRAFTTAIFSSSVKI